MKIKAVIAVALLMAASFPAQAQVNHVTKMGGTWSPKVEGQAGEIIIEEDGTVSFNMSNASLSASASRCIGGTNFCFEGRDQDGVRFRCAYSIGVLGDNTSLINSIFLIPTRESTVRYCPRGEFHRSI